MQDDQVVEMLGFDASGALVGRAAVCWASGNWTVWGGGALTCNIWGRGEAERLLRHYGAVDIRESDGRR